MIKTLLAYMGWHADANETSFFTRQLEFLRSKTYDVLYPDLKARLFIPVETDVPSGAESFIWRRYDWAGMAKILANYSDDLPRVDVLAFEEVQRIRSIGNSYGYTVQDLRASQMAGISLDVKRGQAARRAIENKIDALAAVGDAAAGLPGLLNHANIPLLTKPALTGDWELPGTTPQQILDDLNLIANTVVTQSNEVHKPNTLLLPTSRFSILASKVWSVNDSRTILQVFLQNTPYITNVDQWSKLNLADAAGTGPRAIAYSRDPNMVGLVIPQDFEQFPPQPRNLAFEIPCHARIGGTVWYYPLSAVYADDI